MHSMVLFTMNAPAFWFVSEAGSDGLLTGNRITLSGDRSVQRPREHLKIAMPLSHVLKYQYTVCQ